MSDTDVYTDGRLHVRAAQCDRCLFSPHRLVSGATARHIVASSRSPEGSSFICHRSQVSDEPPAICRVWWDRFAQDDWIMRLAIAMGIVEWVR